MAFPRRKKMSSNRPCVTPPIQFENPSIAKTKRSNIYPLGTYGSRPPRENKKIHLNEGGLGLGGLRSSEILRKRYGLPLQRRLLY